MDARVTEYAVSEAKARFSELLARVEAGEELTIKRHGRVVARLSPVAEPATAVRTLEDRLKSWDDWFAYRDRAGISLPEGMTAVDLLAETRGD